MFNSQAGVTFANKPGDVRARFPFLLNTEPAASPQGQFYLQKESHWNLGIQFHLT